MSPIPHITYATPSQVDFAARIGVNVSGCSLGVADARIQDFIDRGFHNKSNLGQPTPKQIALAEKFGIDISTVSRREGDAVVNDLMLSLNLQAIAAERLEAGTVVTNVHDPQSNLLIISSIHPDGTVFFKGGNGQRAWARSLRRFPDPDLE